ERDERGAERHQQVEERRWIFRRVDERQRREERRRLHGPSRRIAVDIDTPNDDEQGDQGQAEAADQPYAAFGGHLVDGAERAPGGHDPYPRDQRVLEPYDRAALAEHGGEAGLMQDHPQLGRRARRGTREVPGHHSHAVEQVVQRDRADAERGNGAQRQVHERGEHDHRPPDGPDHLHQADEAEVHAEPDQQVEDEYFDGDEPDAARQQK